MATVLIVDDNDLMRDMLVQMIEMEEISAIPAEDGNKAIALLKTNDIDLVITDIVMPEKEGLELIMYLKKKYPNIPVIAISGGARIGPQTYLTTATGLGAKYTFTKPIPRADLLAAVRKCLD